MSLYKFLFNQRTWRISKASKFGKIEHKAGRLIAIPIVVSFLWNLFYQDKANIIITTVIFICWVTYLSAHTIEKKLYGHFGPRG